MTDKQLVEAVAGAMGMTKGGPGISYADLLVKKPLYWQPRAPLVQKDKLAPATFAKVGDNDWIYTKFDNAGVKEFMKSEAAHCEDIEVSMVKLYYQADNRWHFRGGGHWDNEPMKALSPDSNVHMVTLAGYGEPFDDANDNFLLDPEETSYTDLFPNGMYDSDVMAIHDPAQDEGFNHIESFPDAGMLAISTEYYKLGVMDFADFGGEGLTWWLEGYGGGTPGSASAPSRREANAVEVGDHRWVLTGVVSESIPEPASLAPFLMVAALPRRRRSIPR
jgi:hypothetical protein